MFDSNKFDFSPAASESAFDTLIDVVVDGLFYEFEPATVGEAQSYGVIRAARWIAIGFALVCLAALAFGVAIGLLLVTAGQWLGPRLLAHREAIDTASVASALGALRGWVAMVMATARERLGASDFQSISQRVRGLAR